MVSKKGTAMITQKQIRAWIPPAVETFRKYYPLPEDPPYHIINEYPDNPRSIMFTTPENEIFIVRSQVDYSKSSPGKYQKLFNHHYWHELGHVISKINSPKMSAIFWSEFAAEAISLKICKAENNTPMAVNLQEPLDQSVNMDEFDPYALAHYFAGSLLNKNIFDVIIDGQKYTATIDPVIANLIANVEETLRHLIDPPDFWKITDSDLCLLDNELIEIKAMMRIRRLTPDLQTPLP